jgi:hypothetical protein
MEEKNKLEQSYKDEKPINIRDILTCADWEITNVSYDSKSGKYEINAKNNKDGRVTFLRRNRQYVDNLVKELEDAKKSL